MHRQWSRNNPGPRKSHTAPLQFFSTRNVKLRLGEAFWMGPIIRRGPRGVFNSPDRKSASHIVHRPCGSTGAGARGCSVGCDCGAALVSGVPGNFMMVVPAAPEKALPTRKLGRNYPVKLYVNPASAGRWPIGCTLHRQRTFLYVPCWVLRMHKDNKVSDYNIRNESSACLCSVVHAYELYTFSVWIFEFEPQAADFLLFNLHTYQMELYRAWLDFDWNVADPGSTCVSTAISDEPDAFMISTPLILEDPTLCNTYYI